MRIGLFGGTFDPPHQAHLAASLLALKRLKLDRVWWLVTPGNPLKNTSGLGPLKQRIAAARALTHHPRIDVTGLEAVIKTRYTYDTIKWLVARCPGVHFVWIMGADNLRSFHRWQKWRGIAKLVPFAVVDRLGPSLYAAASPAGQALAPRPHPRARRRLSALPQGARLGLPARPQIALVLDGAARLAAADRRQSRRIRRKSRPRKSPPKRVPPNGQAQSKRQAKAQARTRKRGARRAKSTAESAANERNGQRWQETAVALS